MKQLNEQIAAGLAAGETTLENLLKKISGFSRNEVYKELVRQEAENKAWVIIGRRGKPTRCGLGAPKTALASVSTLAATPASIQKVATLAGESPLYIVYSGAGGVKHKVKIDKTELAFA